MFNLSNEISSWWSAAQHWFKRRQAARFEQRQAIRSNDGLVVGTLERCSWIARTMSSFR